jgi:serine O-acetyltransferase
VFLFTELITDVHIFKSMRLPGKGLHIIHSSSIYIHPDTIIGERLGMMHNVCIGTNMGSDVAAIGDDVLIGAGGSIPGKVRIGGGASIAANSLVINDAPAGAFAVGVPAKNIMIPSVRTQREVRAMRKEAQVSAE